MKSVSRAGFEKELKKMISTGVADFDLLEFLWKYEQAEFLVDLMKQTTLLCDWKFNDDDKLSYFIPSLLSQSQNELDHAQVKREIDGNTCVFQFEFLPVGVFDRLVCLCVGYSAKLRDSDLPNLPGPIMQYKDSCTVWLGDNDEIRLFLDEGKKQIQLIVGSNKEIARHSLTVISSMLLKLKQDVIGTGIRWRINFIKHITDSENIVLTYDEAVKEMLDPWFGADDPLGGDNEEHESAHIDIDSYLLRLQEL
mmetsp:Transcript_733/g.905  ORF Transcript_733/g.905 Transcript_733/m.905 type:complete len:252 (-) Transcript_733:448-1203(-)